MSRARALWPTAAIVSGSGPMKWMLHELHTSAKCAFSARNPYPGWIASTSAISAAAMIEGMFRYDALPAAAPMQIVSVAWRRYSASASASE